MNQELIDCEIKGNLIRLYLVNFEYEVIEPCDGVINSQWRREDFIKRDIYAFLIRKPFSKKIIYIRFGDTLEKILKKLRYVAHNVYIPKIKEGK